MRRLIARLSEPSRHPDLAFLEARKLLERYLQEYPRALGDVTEVAVVEKRHTGDR